MTTTVALVILDARVPYPQGVGEANVLLVVRDPATNSTHPNVVSVPTARVPAELHDALWPSAVTSTHGWTQLARWRPRDSASTGGADPVIHVTSSILARKLGLGDALESGRVSFEAGVVGRTTGWSHYGEEQTPSAERLTMLAVLVMLGSGASELPPRTASYSEIRWTPVARFLDAARTKDPGTVDLDPLELCIHGLCIASAHDVLGVAVGMPPYPRAPETLDPPRRAG